MLIQDGFNSLEGGMNSGLEPELLQNNACSCAINLNIDTGLASTRPPMNYQFNIIDTTTALFQGAYIYRMNNVDRLISVFNGSLYITDLNTQQTISYASLLDASVSHCFFCKAERYCVIQDGVSSPVILDGDQLFTGTSQVPKGTTMAYGHGRLFVVPLLVPGTAVVGKPFILAGDILLPKDPSSILKFTDNTYLAEGGAIGLPQELGFICGMSFLRNSTTGSGLGPLIVFAQTGVCSFAVNSARSQWKDIDFSQVLFQGPSAMSDWAITPINNDLLFRAIGGLRSLQYSVRAASNSITNAFISVPVTTFMDLDSRENQKNLSSCRVKNYYYLTFGYDQQTRAHKGVVVLYCGYASSFEESSPPTYNGAYVFNSPIYTCFNARIGENGDDQLGVLYKDRNNNVVISVLDEKNATGKDTTSLEQSQQIPAILYSRALIGKDQYGNSTLFITKELQFVELWFKKITTDSAFDVSVWYRPIGASTWQGLNSYVITLDKSVLRRHIDRLRFTPAAVYNSPDLGFKPSIGMGFEFAIMWLGQATLTALKAEMLVMPAQKCEGSNVLFATEDFAPALIEEYTP